MLGEGPFARRPMPMPEPAAEDDFRAAPGWAALRETFLAWERLRVAYVVVLAGLCSSLALLCGPETYADPLFWLHCAIGAVGANVAFFAGPVAESYLGWLSFPRRPVRFVTFAVGLSFSAVLATVCVLFHDLVFD